MKTKQTKTWLMGTSLFGAIIIVLIMMGCQKENSYQEYTKAEDTGSLKVEWGLNNWLWWDEEYDEWVCLHIPVNCFDDIIIVASTQCFPGNLPFPETLDEFIDEEDDASIAEFFESNGEWEEYWSELSTQSDVRTKLASGEYTLGRYPNYTNEDFMYFVFKPSFRSTFDNYVDGNESQRGVVNDSTYYVFIVHPVEE